MFGALKDKIVSTAAARWLNAEVCRQYPTLGTMTSFHIDSVARRISITADLAGEEKPIKIDADYVIEEEKMKLTAVKVSREWLNVLAAKHAVGRSFDLPELVTRLGLV